jgi:hypothetical protein
VDNVILTDMPAGTVKGRALGAGTGDPTDLTAAQFQAMVPLSYRNILGRNGGFEVWQRGAGGSANFNIPTGGRYTADGWWCWTDAATNVFFVNQTPANNPGSGSSYACLMQRGDGNTATNLVILEFPLDSDEIAKMRGETVTLSFIAWKAAGWSPAGSILQAQVVCGTGPVSRFTGGAWTGVTFPGNAACVLTTALTRFVVTSSVPIPANTTQACVRVYWTPVGTASADLMAIDDVQLEIGSVATPFERRPFESELQACRRHYYKTFMYPTAPAQNIGFNSGELNWWALLSGAGNQGFQMRLPVDMRAMPTTIGFNTSAANAFARNQSAGADFTTTSLAGSANSVAVNGAGPVSTATGHQLGVHFTADAGI